MTDSFTIFMDLPRIARGDDVVIPLRIVDSDQQPVDISGDDMLLTFKDDLSVPDSDAPLHLGVTIGDSAFSQDGNVNIALSSDLTNLPIGFYDYDIQWIRLASGDGTIHTLYRGTVEIFQDVTRSRGAAA